LTGFAIKLCKRRDIPLKGGLHTPLAHPICAWKMTRYIRPDFQNLGPETPECMQISHMRIIVNFQNEKPEKADLVPQKINRGMKLEKKYRKRAIQQKSAWS
jgi:hypothetical protein